MLKVGFSDMMCDVGNAAIKDAIANIARNRKILHFSSCIARFLGYFSGLATRTKPLARRTLPRMANPALLGVADVVWVTEKGDSCDPSTPDDAGRTSASELLEEHDPLLLAGGSELCPPFWQVTG